MSDGPEGGASKESLSREKTECFLKKHWEVIVNHLAVRVWDIIPMLSMCILPSCYGTTAIVLWCGVSKNGIP